MSMKCVDAITRYFPEIPEGDLMTLLWGATCFPFGSDEQVEAQLRELHELGITTLDGALAHAEAVTAAAMAQIGRKR
ncbi:MAG: hypothetical protein WC683_07695 [bacterium]